MKAVPLGAYDPYGTFANAANIRIEHIYLPWSDLELSTLQKAGDYAKARNRELLITVEPWSWSPEKRASPQQLHAGIVSGAYDGTM